MKYLITNLLINEPPLQVLPSLASSIGLNEAIVVQQIHYWTRISKNERDGFIWVYKTIKQWQEEFPFWSEKTIRRTIKKLENASIVVSTSIYNKMGIDRTKWYRIDYVKLQQLSYGQNDHMVRPKCPDANGQNDQIDLVKMTAPITREYTENTTENNNVVKHDNALSVYKAILDYLNAKAKTNYRHTTKKTQKLIKARLSEGFTVDDFYSVIDKKVAEWKLTEFEKFLRPETLFGTKFEGYLQQPLKTNTATVKSKEYKVPQNANKPFNFGE